MKKYPLINILILNWNGKKVLNNCLKSILTSSYKNYKITVIDNGSSDDSLKDLNKISNKINIIKIDKNLGYSKGYNYAFKKLKNDNDDYYFLLNNDTIIYKDTLERLHVSINQFGSNNIFSPKILNSNNNLIWYAGGRQSPFTKLTYHIGLNSDEKRTEYKTTTTDFVSGCAMLISKSLVDSLNGFNESLKVTCDYDFFLRAAKIYNFQYILFSHFC